MGMAIRNYDYIKKQSLLKNINLSLEEMYILKEKLNQLNSSYSDVDFYCYINKFYNRFNELLEISKKSINKVFAYCEEAERTTSQRLSELNLKLEIINMETKVLNGVCDLRCTFEKNSFENFIKPSDEYMGLLNDKKLQYYSMGMNWRFILEKDPKDITDQEYMLLSYKYLDMNVNEMNIFLSSQLKYHKSDNIYITSFWCTDYEISNKINRCINSILDDELGKLITLSKNNESDDYNKLQFVNCEHLQKAALLNSIKSIGVFQDFDDKLQIEKSNGEYCVNYYDVELKYDGSNFYTTPLPRQLRVSMNYCGENTTKHLLNKLANTANMKFNKSLSEVALEEFSGAGEDLVLDQSGKAIEIITKSSIIGEAGGIFINKTIDAHKKYLENKENLECFMNIHNQGQIGDYCNNFQLNIVFSDILDGNNSKCLSNQVFIQPSDETYEVINRFNNSPLAVELNGGKKITLYDVLNNSDTLIKILDNIDQKRNEDHRNKFSYIVEGK